MVEAEKQKQKDPKSSHNTFSNAGDIIDAGIFDHMADLNDSEKMRHTIQEEGFQNSFSDMGGAHGAPPSDYGQKVTELNDMKLDSDKEESAIDQHMTAIVREKEEE